jgi:putative ABC transport system permease protein
MRAETFELVLRLRSLWSHRDTAAAMFLLSVLASTAAAAGPLYGHAGGESLLLGSIRSSSPFQAGVHLTMRQTVADTVPGAADGPTTVLLARRYLPPTAFGAPILAWSRDEHLFVDTGPLQGGQVNATLMERPGACSHLTIVLGRCATGVREAVVSTRSLHVLGIGVGDDVPGLHLGGQIIVDGPNLGPVGDSASARSGAVKVVGVYAPVTTEDDFWGGRNYFSRFFVDPSGTASSIDPVLLGQGTAAAGGVSGFSVDIPLRPRDAAQAEPSALDGALTELSAAAQRYGLEVTAGLPTLVAEARRQGRDLQLATPMIAAQLVLLAIWTQFVTVGAASRVRTAEVALMKMRGMSWWRTSWTVRGEYLLLQAVAVPVGAVLAQLIVHAMGKDTLAYGTSITFVDAAWIALLVQVLGSAAATVVATRVILHRPAVDLLKRTGSVTGRRQPSLTEVVVSTLAVVGLVQVLRHGQRMGPIALATPAMVALVSGLLAARLMDEISAKRATVTAQHSWSVLAWANLRRRTTNSWCCSVVAITTCMLLVGLLVWRSGGDVRGGDLLAMRLLIMDGLAGVLLAVILIVACAWMDRTDRGKAIRGLRIVGVGVGLCDVRRCRKQSCRSA